MEFAELKKVSLYSALSTLGRDIFQPNGVFYWAGRAKKEAEINATIGTAKGFLKDFYSNPEEPDKYISYYLPDIEQWIGLDAQMLVNYAPVCGVPAVRDGWEKWIRFKASWAKGSNYDNDPSKLILAKPVVCAGITNAIFLTTRLFLNPGESIICPDKRWGNYNGILIRQNGLKIDEFEFFKDSKFNDKGLAEVIEKVGQDLKKVVLLLNFPNNPTGYCPLPDEIDAIKKVLLDSVEKHPEWPIVILVDDAYEGYVFDEARIKASLFYYLQDLHPNIIPIKLDGPSKEMLLYGARIAYITLGINSKWLEKVDEQKFRAEWENKLEAMVRTTMSNANHFTQELLAEMLSKGNESIVNTRSSIIDTLKNRYQACMDIYKKLKTPGTSLDPAGGGFFLFMNLEKLDASETADILLKEEKVGLIPIQNKSKSINGLRIAYASVPIEKIESLFTKIDKTIRKLTK